MTPFDAKQRAREWLREWFSTPIAKNDYKVRALAALLTAVRDEALEEAVELGKRYGDQGCSGDFTAGHIRALKSKGEKP